MTISLLFIFVEWCSKIMYKKFQVNLTKIEGVTAIFVIFPITTILVITFNSKARGPRPTPGPEILVGS